MARPENSITEQGPVANLARALREVRARAGSPTYRNLAEKALHSASVLADAASGKHCPTWRVTESFAAACGADPETLRSLWAEANKHDRARRQAARRHSRPKLATVKRLPRPNAGNRPADPRIAHGPDPWAARTPAEYVHLLRALRAWAGYPAVKDVREVSATGGPVARVPRSTFYAALNPSRTSLPPLVVVRSLVRACGADVDEWVSAWRALSLREFDKANPSPIPSDRQVPPAGPGPDATVRALDRPAQ
jgi:hypothetical protein